MLIPGTSSGSLNGLEFPGAASDSKMVGGGSRKGIRRGTADRDWLLVLRGTCACGGIELLGGIDLARFCGGNCTVLSASTAEKSVNCRINALYLHQGINAYLQRRHHPSSRRLLAPQVG